MIVIYVLEIICLLLFLWGVLGYEARVERLLLAIGVAIVICGGIIIFLFHNAYELLFASRIAIPSIAMAIIFYGRPTIIIGIGICLTQTFSLLDTLYIGISILKTKANIMSINLELTYILGEITCIVMFSLLALLLRKHRKQIAQGLEKLNVFWIFLFIVCSLLINYNPWYVGETSTLLPQIIHGQNLVKNGVLGIAVICILCLIYVVIIQKKALKRMVVLNERCIKEQAMQYRRVSEETQALKKFRHDYNAHITTLQAIVHDGDIGRIQDYVDNLTELKSKQKLVYTNNLVCDAILSEYANYCTTEDIELKVRGNFPVDLFISDTDLCILISNGISNAFEAVRQCKQNRRIYVNIGNNENYVMITMKNSAVNVPIIRGGRLISTKRNKNDHGFGAQNMLEAAKHSGGSVNWHIEKVGETIEVVTEVMIIGGR